MAFPVEKFDKRNPQHQSYTLITGFPQDRQYERMDIHNIILI